MNNEHAAHRPPGIIPHPLIPVQEIRLNPRIRIPLGNAINNVGNERGRVTRSIGGVVLSERGRNNFGQCWRVKVVEAGLYGVSIRAECMHARDRRDSRRCFRARGTGRR